jgi:hypothetical protein
MNILLTLALYSLVPEASEEPLIQHTTNTYHNSNPTTDTIFHFHRVNVENIVLALILPTVVQKQQGKIRSQ